MSLTHEPSLLQMKTLRKYKICLAFENTIEVWLLTKTHCRCHPGDNPGATFKSIFHRCYVILVAFVWELTK
jgi:hypothetical protein